MEYLNEKNKLELLKQLIFCPSLCVCAEILNALACWMNSKNVIKSGAGTITTAYFYFTVKTDLRLNSIFCLLR